MAGGFLDTPRKWLILGCITVIHFVVFGVTKAFGLLFVATMSRYGTSRKLASLPFVLPFTFLTLAGPMAAYLSTILGLRFVMALGCFLCSLGLGASFFVEDIAYVIVFIGVGYGIGYGFSMSLYPQMLLHHFEGHIDKANGLALGISGVCSFFLIEGTNHLLSAYGLSGTFLLLAGVSLHGIPATMLLRKSKVAVAGTASDNSAKGKKYQDCQGKVPKTDHALLLLPMCESDREKSNGENGEERPSNFCKENDILDGDSAAERTKLCDVSLEINTTCNDWQRKGVGDAETMNNLTSPSTQPTNSTVTQTLQNSSKHKTLYEKSPPFKLFRVFLDPAFIALCLWHALSIFPFIAFVTIVADVAVDKGSSLDQSVTVLLGFAVAETLGRGCFGYFTDAGYISKVNFVTLCSFLLGTLYLLFAWLQGFVAVLIASCLIGLLLGGLTMISVGIVAMYVEKSAVRMATASKFILYLPLSICQPYVIGYFRDTLKSYDGLFYTTSLMLFFCVAISTAVPALAKHREKSKRKTSFVEDKDRRDSFA